MHEMQKFNSVDELVNTIRPVDPIYCIRPNSIKSACNWFKSNFPGQILYAVKTNPNEKVIKHIGESGINRFDVASINEIKLIKNHYFEGFRHFQGHFQILLKICCKIHQLSSKSEFVFNGFWPFLFFCK